MNSYQKTCAVLAMLSTSTITYASPTNAHSPSNLLSHNITLGYQAKTDSGKDSAIAIGAAASSTNNQSIAIGTNAHANDNSAVAFGAASSATGIQSTATGSHAIAIGNYASADASTIALGDHAQATGKNSIAIGNGSQSNDGQVSFGNAKLQRRLEHVANGKANTDAVNMGQLHQQITQSHIYTQQQKNNAIIEAKQYLDKQQQIAVTETKHYVAQQNIATLNNAKTYTDQQAVTTLSAANQYTDQKVNLLTHRIEKVHNQANAGIASAMAMSSIPMRQGYHYTIGMGAANYGNQSAMAIGGKFDVGQHSIVTLAASDDSQHNAGIAAGFGFGF
ncbi:YadA-like family protein [Photobacterium sp. Alg240-V54]|uniref:YadA-like family protein n=1 Tax=Photobacterium sp. Alg240-V54 TaxID=2305995 RepID=UPI0013D2BF82|nr:YadA-like family protein [Photobacterium sp. Alg240-V54]